NSSSSHCCRVAVTMSASSFAGVPHGVRPIATTSRTVNGNATVTSWGMTARRRAASFTDSSRSSVSPMCTLPGLVLSVPEHTPRRVDLPAPLGPMIAVTDPGARRRDTSSRMARFPMSTLARLLAASLAPDPLAPQGAAEQQQEQRSADNGGEDPDREIREGNDGTGGDVREAEQDGPAEGGQRDEEPVRGSDREAQRVGHDEPDERDDSRERDVDPGEEADEQDRDDAQGLHVRSRGRGRRIPQREHVELLPDGQAAGEAGGEDHAGHGDALPAGVGERTELPEHHLLPGGGVAEEDEETRAGPGDRVDRDPGEDAREDGGLAARAGEGPHGERGEQGAGEGGERQQPRADEGESENDRDGRPHRAPGAHPDDARLR